MYVKDSVEWDLIKLEWSSLLFFFFWFWFWWSISSWYVLINVQHFSRMMNIVQSQNNKLVTKFEWAKILESKYNLTVKFVVNHSWECQQKYLSYAYDPYQNRWASLLSISTWENLSFSFIKPNQNFPPPPLPPQLDWLTNLFYFIFFFCLFFLYIWFDIITQCADQ